MMCRSSFQTFKRSWSCTVRALGGVPAELAAWTTAQDWHDFTVRKFAQWPSPTGPQHASVAQTIETAYAAEMTPVARPKLTYHSLNTDGGITCGSDKLAQAAAHGYSKPVLRGSSSEHTNRHLGLNLRVRLSHLGLHVRNRDVGLLFY